MKNLDDEALELVARYFGALLVPMRLKILNQLREGERNVGEITAATGCTQANVSKHLSVLAQNGLVAKTQRGTSAYYRFASESVYRLCDLVCDQLDRRFSQEAEKRRAFTGAAKAAAASAAEGARAGAAACRLAVGARGAAAAPVWQAGRESAAMPPGKPLRGSS